MSMSQDPDKPWQPDEPEELQSASQEVAQNQQCTASIEPADTLQPSQTERRLQHQAHTPSSKSKLQRTPVACTRCRHSKIRCTRIHGAGPCDQCFKSRRALSCVFLRVKPTASMIWEPPLLPLPQFYTNVENDLGSFPVPSQYWWKSGPSIQPWEGVIRSNLDYERPHHGPAMPVVPRAGQEDIPWAGQDDISRAGQDDIPWAGQDDMLGTWEAGGSGYSTEQLPEVPRTEASRVCNCAWSFLPPLAPGYHLASAASSGISQQYTMGDWPPFRLS